ncbi:hypothetical protein G7Y79_00013g034150 [Physcia stellaris]|nr:hypothetical protein G7Y79_00013g034150 [Physcia stellaris]
MTSPKTQAISRATKSKDVIVVETQAEKYTQSKDLKKGLEKENLASKTVKDEEEEILYDLTDDLSPSEAEKDQQHVISIPDIEDPPKSPPQSDGVEHEAGASATPQSDSPKQEPFEPYVEHDPQMALLADRMDKAMGFGAAAVTNVHVPRGYIFDFEITGPEFWKAHDNAPRGTKRKHEEEEAVQRHGFLAEDVINCGAVQMPGARLPTLKNEIHPLFQRNAFDGCEDDVYAQFIPALRLASMFMTHPTCSRFWITLAWGERTVDETMTSRMGRLQHRILKDVEISPEKATKVTDYIRNIANKYRVHFTFVQRMMAGGIKWAGVTQKVENFSCDVEWSPNQKRDPTDPDLLRIHTRLSSDWYVAAKKLSKLTFPDTAQLLRFSFGFAVLITHEICHAIELAHIRTRPDWVPDSSWNMELQQEIGHEPFFHDNHIPELGYTWEKYIFGGKVWPINDRMDCLHGLCITDWPIRSIDIWDSSKVEYHTIPMTYIERLFQMKTWEQDLNIMNPKLWHVPRNGAKSIYLHSFTTMDYNEEQRIKNEEAEELRAEHERKPPANKKRRTSIKDQDNAVPLSTTGDEALGTTLEEDREPHAKVAAPGTPKIPLAQRSFKTPKVMGKKSQSLGRAKGAKVSGSEETNAQHAARRVGLGSGRKR